MRAMCASATTLLHRAMSATTRSCVLPGLMVSGCSRSFSAFRSAPARSSTAATAAIELPGNVGGEPLPARQCPGSVVTTKSRETRFNHGRNVGKAKETIAAPLHGERAQLSIFYELHEHGRRIQHEINSLAEKIGDCRHAAFVGDMLKPDVGFSGKKLHRKMLDRADAGCAVMQWRCRASARCETTSANVRNSLSGCVTSTSGQFRRRADECEILGRVVRQSLGTWPADAVNVPGMASSV